MSASDVEEIDVDQPVQDLIERNGDGEIDYKLTLDRTLEELTELEQRVDELESQVESNTSRLEAVHTSLKTVRKLLYGSEPVDWAKTFVQDHAPIIHQLKLEGNSSPIERLGSRLQEEQKMRTQADALIRKEVDVLANEADVDLTDAEMVEQDNISRIRAAGLAEVVNGTPTRSQERAEALLANLEDVGTHTTKATIGSGYRVTVNEATEFLADEFDVELWSSQVKRVFEEIEDWAGTSPRAVRLTKSDNKNVLFIQTREVSD